MQKRYSVGSGSASCTILSQNVTWRDHLSQEEKVQFIPCPNMKLWKRGQLAPFEGPVQLVLKSMAVFLQISVELGSSPLHAATPPVSMGSARHRSQERLCRQSASQCSLGWVGLEYRYLLRRNWTKIHLLFQTGNVEGGLSWTVG